MNELWQSAQRFVEDDQAFVAIAVGASVLTFLGSLIAVPVVVIRMREDYFVRATDSGIPRTPLRLLGRLAKNLLGWLLVLAGVAMLVLPGQGLLTIALGIGLVDFPGKRKAQLRLARVGAVKRSMDWIRKRAGKPPLEMP